MAPNSLRFGHSAQLTADAKDGISPRGCLQRSHGCRRSTEKRWWRNCGKMPCRLRHPLRPPLQARARKRLRSISPCSGTWRRKRRVGPEMQGPNVTCRVPLHPTNQSDAEPKGAGKGRGGLRHRCLGISGGAAAPAEPGSCLFGPSLSTRFALMLLACFVWSSCSACLNASCNTGRAGPIGCAAFGARRVEGAANRRGCRAARSSGKAVCG